MQQEVKYQVAIVGGGLAGLTLAIQMADAGYTCVLFEKNKYPFHKVCGEYISMESWDFLERCGLNLSELSLPKINRLHVSSPSGKLLTHRLSPGGFGISRFLLDASLAKTAKSKGVLLLEDCKITDINFKDEQFTINSVKGIFYSGLCVGTWGKRSNLDQKLSREFIKENKAGKNYVGVKYHVRIDLPADLIGLHNFEDGYCGISKIEDNKYCLCYLTNSENLKKYKGNIKEMESNVLMKNPFLKKYFNEAIFLFNEPVTISQINIGNKRAVENNVLMLGDAAGNIAPLSGNGMSMAMRSSFVLAKLIRDYFNQKISRSELERDYSFFWDSQFKKRIKFSAFLQSLLKNPSLTNIAIMILKRVSFLRNRIVKFTHGEPF